MNKSEEFMDIIEVNEFDKITYNKKCPKHIEESQFNELKKAIYEFDTNQGNSNILDFMKIGYKRGIGETITIRNYVGLIELKSGLKIQILPKIALGKSADSKKKTKEVFIKMIKSMKDFKNKEFSFANLNTNKMDVYEIFINIYIQEVRKLVKKGLKSSYISNENNINFFKGKLQVNQHIKLNMCHKEKFFMRFDEYEVNRPENRIIKSTLLKLQKISNSTQNKKEIRQMLTAFELVDASKNYEKDFSKIVINRDTKEYEMLMNWSKTYLCNKSFTTFSGEICSKAILFPMEKVFEQYVARYIKKLFSANGFEVRLQDRSCYLFNYPRKEFAIRPDMVVKCKKDGRIIILDTKWKYLKNNVRENYGISQMDMYQVYAYAKKYRSTEIYLIYPRNEEMEEYEEERQIKFASDDGIYVKLFFVDVDQIEKSVEKVLKDINKKASI